MLWSGGKDSTLALHRARAGGLDVRWLFNLFDGESGRVRFHGVRRELITLQAKALGLEVLQLPSTMADYERVFLHGLERLRDSGVADLVFGNIHLADVRAWYEERTTGLGFNHHEPLWGSAPLDVVRQVDALGYRAIITSVDVERAPRDWLGQVLSPALVVGAAIDAAGESGEYHTFVVDGPLFSEPLRVVPGAVMDAGTHALLDLSPA